VNLNFQLSSDGSTYYAASGPLQLLPTAPPAPQPSLSAVLSATNLVLQWIGGATLQTTPSLQGGWTSLTTSNTLGPFSMPIQSANAAQYFRLRFP
jgi:hypothetical protein